MSTTVKAHIALTAVAFLYGSNYVIAKVVLGSGLITPEGFIMLRIAMAGILIWLVHPLIVRESVERKDLPYLALCSVFGVLVNTLCFFKGLAITSPMHASMIMILTPIIVLIASYFILKSKILVRQVIGIGIGLVGAALLISSAGNSDKMASVLGDIYVLINATSYAIYLVLIKRMMEKYHALTVVKWVFLFGCILVIPFGLPDLLAADIHLFTSDHWWSVAFVIVGATFFTYTLNAFALATVKPSTVSFYIYFQPLIATGISIALGQDTLDVIKVAAAALLFVGVYFVIKKR